MLITLTINSKRQGRRQSQHEVATAQELKQLVSELTDAVPFAGDLDVHFGTAEGDVPALLGLLVEAFPLEQQTSKYGDN